MTENMNGETVRRWLPAMIVGFGLAVSWGSFQTQLDVMADEVSELKADNSEHDNREADQNVQVEVLKTNQESIKSDIEEIKEAVKEQDKKLDKILDELRKQ